MKYPFKKQNYKFRNKCSQLIHPHVEVIFKDLPEEERLEFSSSPWKDLEEYKSYRIPFRDLYNKCMGQGNSDNWLIIFAGKDRLTKQIKPELDKQIEEWNAELN